MAGTLRDAFAPNWQDAPSRRLVFVLQRTAGRLVVGFTGVQVTVKGLEHVRGKHRVITSANHTVRPRGFVHSGWVSSRKQQRPGSQ